MKTISCGFFIRGAVTIGPCQEKAEIMFGPACVSAYEIEKFLARWPRCIIDRDLLNRSDIYPNNSWRNRNKYILIGDDGLPYLDYLGYAYINFLGRSLRKSPNEALKVPEVIFLTLRAHKKAIIQSVQEAVKNIEIRNILLSKYYPLAVYHNQVIQRLIPKYDDPGYIKEMSEDYKEMTGELIREDEIQFLLPLLKKDGEKWQVSLEEQSIDIEALFG